MARKDPLTEEELQEIFRLRRSGLSYTKIGIIFKRDQSTIGAWCKGKKVLPIKIEPKKYKYEYLFDEPVNRGKLTYAEYVKEAGLKVVLIE